MPHIIFAEKYPLIIFVFNTIFLNYSENMFRVILSLDCPYLNIVKNKFCMLLTKNLALIGLGDIFNEFESWSSMISFFNKNIVKWNWVITTEQKFRRISSTGTSASDGCMITGINPFQISEFCLDIDSFHTVIFITSHPFVRNNWNTI